MIDRKLKKPIIFEMRLNLPSGCGTVTVLLSSKTQSDCTSAEPKVICVSRLVKELKCEMNENKNNLLLLWLGATGKNYQWLKIKNSTARHPKAAQNRYQFLNQRLLRVPASVRWIQPKCLHFSLQLLFF